MVNFICVAEFYLVMEIFILEVSRKGIFLVKELIIISKEM
jgi:hypothetical protein